MKHKWHDEIVAWAGGAEIEAKEKIFGEWLSINDVPNYYHDSPNWNEERLEFRIKPQQVPYWLCCGDIDRGHKNHHHQATCFGTADEHSKRCGGTVAPKAKKYLYFYRRVDGMYISEYPPTDTPHSCIGKIEVQDD